MLFAVADAYLNAKLLVYVLGQMLCRVDTAVLASGTSETEHETGEATLYVTAYVASARR